MALNEPTNLDMAVRLPDEDGRIAMVIFDAEPIADAGEREQLLHRKLAGYLKIITSGAMENFDASVVGKAAVIQVVCTYPPTPHMLEIHALRSREDKSVIVPVEVMSLEGFYAQFGMRPPGAAQSVERNPT